MTVQLKELREEQARIATNARAKFDEITNEMPEERVQEVEREYDAMMADYDKLNSKAERLEKLDTIERQMNEADSRRPSGKAEGRGVADEDLPTYREAFANMLRSKVPDAAPLSEADQYVLRQGRVDLPAEQRAQTTTAAAGGYSIPTELSNILVKSMLAWGPMYDPGITTELVTTGGGAIDMPTVNDTTVTAGASAGEAVTLTDDGGKDVTFGQKTLNSYAYDTEWLRVSKELADDSIFAMETLLGSLLGERLGRLANLQLTTGSGSSAPNGIVTASSLGVTAAGTAAITFDEILDLEHSVDPAYRSGPQVRYMLNDATLLAVRKLKDGDGNYLWQMGNVQAGIPSTINGRPYSINQSMASLATGQKVMTFGDMSKYYVRKVGAPLIGAIQDKDFWPGFGVAGYIRFDGELADTAAVKHLITA
jgi:HK97 family phage major capsid protein